MGLTILKERVRELRPLFVPPDPAQRTRYRPGALAQFDCGSRGGHPASFGQFDKLWVVTGRRPCYPASAPSDQLELARVGA